MPVAIYLAKIDGVSSTRAWLVHPGSKGKENKTTTLDYAIQKLS
jgi:hypothetical protein